MWDFLFSGDQRTPEDSLPRKVVNLTHFTDPGNNQLNVTWLGHSSLMINIYGYKILTDPVFERSVSLFGPSRFNGDVPLVVGDHLEDWGVPPPSQHFSGRGLTDRDETLWASFVIKGPKHKTYFGGDSGYFEGFKQIGNKYGPFDMTFIECGAYNEKWRFIHMFPEETVQANIDLGGKILHPIPWATFNLSLHSWFDPMERLTGVADSLSVTTATPVVGETTIYEDYIPTQRWWEEAIVQKN
jgi:L-ascorbate metabolism protein UlaG (beta-lactamase superfamily)